MTKAKKYAINAGITSAIIGMIGNYVIQYDEIQKNPNTKFSFSRLIFAGVKGAVIGSFIGFSCGAVRDFFNSKIKRKNNDGYLTKLSQKLQLSTSSADYKFINNRAEYLTAILGKNFADKLVRQPQRVGSTAKGTALQHKFDIDIALDFRHGSFSSTTEMRDAIFAFIKPRIGSNNITDVRDQHKSVGVLFEYENKSFRIDVVPVKITRGQRDSGYLSIDNGLFSFSRFSYQKTNIRALQGVKLSKSQKRIIVLLKRWRDKNDIPLGSHLLENLVLDAYRYSIKIPRGITEQFIMVIRHIANNIHIAVIRSIENTNNIITDIDSSAKEQITAACKSVLEEYDYQPNSIQKFF